MQKAGELTEYCLNNPLIKDYVHEIIDEAGSKLMLFVLDKKIRLNDDVVYHEPFNTNKIGELWLKIYQFLNFKCDVTCDLGDVSDIIQEVLFYIREQLQKMADECGGPNDYSVYFGENRRGIGNPHECLLMYVRTDYLHLLVEVFQDKGYQDMCDI